MNQFLPNFIKRKIDPGFHKILTNISWLLAERIFHMILSLLIGIWFIRYLGPTRYGIYSYATAIVTLLLPLSKMGMPQVVVRNLVEDVYNKHKILGTAFTLEVVGGILVIPLALTLSFLLRPDESKILVFVGIISIGEVFRSFDVIELWFSSQVESKYSAIVNSCSFLTATLVKVSLIISQSSLLMFVLLAPAEVAITSCLLIAVYFVKVGSVKEWEFDLAYGKNLLRDSWPLIFSGFVIVIYMRSDQIMIARMIDDESVGIYSAAVNLSKVWYFLPMSIINSITPSIMALRQEGELRKYYKRLSELSGSVVLLTYIIAIPITILSGRIVNFLYGSDYILSGMILSLHIWTGCFVALGLVRNIYLVSESLTYISLVSTAIGAAMNLVFNYFLIRQSGIFGAAIATLFTQAFAAYISSALFKQTRDIFWIQSKALMLVNIPGMLRGSSKA